ncbi:VanZ family protein [Bacillus sp. FJAT-45350]|uniref:VanZ family protein n=1 Tax=Bacillus sp. FJAT-45350 TaxID=2011014 RepID=UPI000BB97444|nr:VanZ family protein [Bacillus sp. FJAT-45350]
MKLKIIFFSILAGWVAFIVYLSSQPYHQQDLRPLIKENVNLEFVETHFSSVTFTYAGSEVSVERMGEARYIEFFIRKGAHLFVFFVLGSLIYSFLRALKVERLVLWSFLFIVLFAISDELHQAITPHRTPLVEDVLLDVIGGTLGILIVRFILTKKYTVGVGSHQKEVN